VHSGTLHRWSSRGSSRILRSSSQDRSDCIYEWTSVWGQVTDMVVFRSTRINRNGWNYGITDLVPEVAESDSGTVKPTREHCEGVIRQIKKYRPRAVVILHSKVAAALSAFLGVALPLSGPRLGRLIPTINSEFFRVSFPHGNSVPAESKIIAYKEVREWLEAGTNVPHRKHVAASPMSIEARRTGPPRRALGTSRADTIELARRIDRLVERWLRRTGVAGAKPKELMRMLVDEGVFPKDHKEGLPLRKLLRHLDDHGQLSVMTTVRVKRGPINRSW